MLRAVILIATAVLQCDRVQCEACKHGVIGCTWEHEKLGEHLLYGNQPAENRLRSSHYDRSVRPFYMTDKPTVVYVEIYLVRLGPVDQSKLEFDMDIFLRQRWVDPRLTNPYERGADSRSMHYALKECMWVPDLIFINEMHSSFHEFTVLNQLLHILPNGRITFSQRLALTLMCNMDLTNFPLDSQTCSVRLESYSSRISEVVFTWTQRGVITGNISPFTIPEFKMDKVVSDNCSATSSTGTYPCIIAKFHFKRQFNYYLIQFYLPTTLIVVLSWVSFWIDEEHIPARVSLGILTVLTMSSQSETISSQLPRASYIKAADVWLSTCLLFAFAALVEFCVMSVLQRELHLVELAEEIKRWELIITHQNVPPRQIKSTTSEISEPRLSSKVKFKEDVQMTRLDVPMTKSDPSNCSSGSCTCSLYSVESATLQIPSESLRSPSSSSVAIPTFETRKISQKRPSIMAKSAAALQRLSQFSQRTGRPSRASQRLASGRPSMMPSRRPFACVTKCFNLSRKHRDPLIDNMSKILFPIGFGIFNLVYWAYYLR